jgi:CRP-like cAMP-binding protein
MHEKERTELLEFLKQNELFSDLTPEEFIALLPYVHITTYPEGKWMIREGEIGEHLYIIKTGRAEVVKEDKERGLPHIIGVLEPGDWVGEMAHFEQGPRSASVRAFDNVDAVCLMLQELSDSPEHAAIYQKIAPKLSKRLSQRLRKVDDILTKTLRDKLELLMSSNQVSKTIIYMLILFAVFFNVVAAYDNYGGALKGIIKTIFMPTSIAMFGFAALRLIQKSGYPLSFYGITTERAGRCAIEGFLFTLPILGLMTLFKWALISYIPQFKDADLLPFAFNQTPLREVFYISAIYVLLSPLQELIVRGFLQSSFRNFFQGENRVFYAILSSNILFEVLHTANDLFLAIFSFIFGIFWGAMYEHQKSLVGVSISHIMIGWWCIYALDILSMAPQPIP